MKINVYREIIVEDQFEIDDKFSKLISVPMTISSKEMENLLEELYIIVEKQFPEGYICAVRTVENNELLIEQ